MIEIIYQGEEEKTNEETELKLPKNVRQIGDCELENVKIYVEDFVMTYVKHFSSRNMKYGILLGNIKKSKSITYIFITGAVCAKPHIDNDIIFDEDVWTSLYEDIKTFFENVEIFGWFLSTPGVLSNDMVQIQKIHLDNFAGNDKVFFMLDRSECEDSFYIYNEGGMKKCNGHYIYYEKNADMQSYMVMNEEVSEVPKDYEQSKKRIINARVHKLLYKTETDYDGSREEYALTPYQTAEGRLEDNQSYSGKKGLPAFAYSASSFMIIAMLLAAVAIMNASGQLNELKAVVAGIGAKDEVEEIESDAKIIEVGKDLEPTSDSGADENATESNNASGDNEQNSTQQTEQDTSQSASDESSGQNESEQDTITESQETVTENQETVTENQETESTPEPTIVPSANVNRKYVVKKGDSLYSISIKEYGSADMVNNIMSINGISDGNRIKEGDIILLP